MYVGVRECDLRIDPNAWSFAFLIGLINAWIWSFAEFIAALDSLYEERNVTIYPLPNPLRKSTEALHNKITAQIFQYAQFPIRNWFKKDSQTGIVNRTFVGVTGVRYFTIVLPASEKMTLAATQTTKAIS